MPPKTPSFPKADPWGTVRERIKSHMCELCKVIKEDFKKMNNVLCKLKDDITKQAMDLKY